MTMTEARTANSRLQKRGFRAAAYLDCLMALKNLRPGNKEEASKILDAIGNGSEIVDYRDKKRYYGNESKKERSMNAQIFTSSSLKNKSYCPQETQN